MRILFNKPYLTGKELRYIKEAHASGHLSGDGQFTERCNKWLEKQIGCKKALLTQSCTTALEMAAILANIQPGDEIIMPSYTFVSTANAFVLRGGVPVFVDIRSDTLNIDETKIEAAITKKTKAIVPVHYAGVGCEMDKIMKIADKYGLLVIEDAAQGIMSTYKGKPLGGIGQLSGLSFHDSKNIISGEGGALIINDVSFIERAEIIRDKGTNRKKFFRGEIDKYTWIDIGSSCLPSEITAAFLWGQIEKVKSLTQRRLSVWNTYHEAFESYEKEGVLRRPIIPDYCAHNAHLYYILLKNFEQRTEFISKLKKRGILSVFHYVPLHTSLAGKRYCKVNEDLIITNDISERLVRLPLWIGIEKYMEYILRNIKKTLRSI